MKDRNYRLGRPIGIDQEKQIDVVTESIYRKKYCLSIGINLYQYWPRLHYAVQDAISVSRVLKENYRFNTFTLIDIEATKEKIQETIIDGLGKKLRNDDLPIVFFAGHGNTEHLADDEDHGYIVPINARQSKLSDLISMEQLKEWTAYVKSRHILYIFDSCFSGMATLRSGAIRGNRDMLQRKARLTITAGGANQQVADGGWNGHSVFTGQLLLGLDSDAQRDHNGTITATELFTYLANKVPKYAPQTPAIGLDPPPFIDIGPYSQIGNTARSTSRLKSASIDPVGEDVPLFAESGQQWAVIIGTNPGAILSTSKVLYPTEFLDAFDILDWFYNPVIYGVIDTRNLYFWTNEKATSGNVFSGLETIKKSIEPDDSLLFYFSGHATEFGNPGEILLYDAFSGAEWGIMEPETKGLINADRLVKWCNDLPAKKVVCILDSGGPACYKASNNLRAGRYFISSLNSTTLGRNGFITWYVRRAVQKLGRRTTIKLLGQILVQADQFLSEKKRDTLHVYLRGHDLV
jgi:uncharacterized caspase-like protein